MTRVPRDVIERLYAVPPDGFMAARSAAVAAARAAGDPGIARETARLRKPTAAAWLVNLLALRRPELVAGLAELAAALRAAQRELRGVDLRELSTRRRGMIDTLVAEARDLAVAAEPGMASGRLPLADVAATLSAAVADEEIAAQVRSGRLVRAVSYAGFGEVPRPRLRLVVTDDEPDQAAEPDRAAERDRAARRRQLSRELAAARSSQRRAERELERARSAEGDAAEALAGAQRALADLERRRSTAEQELSRHKLARKAAERAVSVARRQAGEIEAAVEHLADHPADDHPADDHPVAGESGATRAGRRVENRDGTRKAPRPEGRSR